MPDQPKSTMSKFPRLTYFGKKSSPDTDTISTVMPTFWVMLRTSSAICLPIVDVGGSGSRSVRGLPSFMRVVPDIFQPASSSSLPAAAVSKGSDVELSA